MKPLEVLRDWRLWLALALVAAMLRLHSGWAWSDIASLLVLFVGGLVIIDGIARDAIGRFWNEAFSPGVGRQRSPLFPRVWRLIFRPTSKFLDRFAAGPPADGGWTTLMKLDSTTRYLARLKIEEYAGRIRIHRWLTGPDEGLDYLSYEWWDVPQRDWVRSSRSPLHDAEHFWSYSTDMMRGVLRLSGLWQQDHRGKRHYLKVVLWFDSLDRQDTPVPESDVVFEIPLDPGLLDDERGIKKFVRGKPRKASEALPYPGNEERWENRRGEGSEFEWEWHLWMQTFDKEGHF